uniref:Uncharacterized protein n=1 Tax=Arundo donax TaxID=35708 RepID=A0A0A9G8E5_ARUDO
MRPVGLHHSIFWPTSIQLSGYWTLTRPDGISIQH